MDRGGGVEEEDGTVPPLRRSRRRRVALVVALALVAALVLLWLERRTIATRFVDRELAASGVPARYTVADLAPGRQRLTNVVIGDPADPDLVADWIETRVGYDLSGAKLEGISAGHVRLRARLADGRVSFGAIDRLLPPPSGKPFALPALNVDVADARIRLETPVGVVGLKIAGAGRLDDGFTGTVAAVAPRLASGGCAAEGVTAAMRVRSVGSEGHGGQRVRLSGPVRAARLRCGEVSVAALRSDVAADLTLGKARGSSVEARLGTGAVTHPLARAAGVAGRVTFTEGGGQAMSGRVDLTARDVRGFGARAGAVTLVGGVQRGSGGGVGYTGKVAVTGADASALVPRFAGLADGTPVGPLVDRIDAATAAAARRFSGEARVALVAGEDLHLRVQAADLRAASGAHASLDPLEDGGAALDWRPNGGAIVNATLSLDGGGLPRATVRATQAARGAPVRGTAAIAPYAAGDARLDLAPVAFTVTPGGAVRISTRAQLSGPLGDGRVEGLTLPIDLSWNGRDRLVLGGGCVPLGWQRLSVGGLQLDPAQLRLCPLGDALLRSTDGRIEGGARLAGTRLTGRLGSTPLTLATGAASIRLDDRGFTVADVTARLGQPGRESRLSIATLTGRLGDGIAGTFAGGGGQIGNVPLILSAAEGRWSLAGGTLALQGALTVSDAAAAPRFRPLSARAVSLTLADGRIAATGTLHEPSTGERVAEVRIDHALATGTGAAAIAVPRLAFREGFQPELLTPLTFGVVADVRGTVTGDARIAWSPTGVTSTGTFGTEALDLAAAFGPVTGIATTLHFTDLLGMRTAPGQVATVRTVNPGIPVEDGTVRYRIAGPTLVQVEGARWPFAGGTLTLDPTLLDFSRERERRLTFRVVGAEARAFLQQFDFDNLDATGTFDGVLPMIFGEAGGRIEDGHLAMRPGGGTIAYVGTLTQEQLGFWGNLAFQALKSLRYRSLSVTLNGPLAGEMVTDVRFAGIAQGAGAKSNVLIRQLQRLPFIFNIRIKAPFRGLLDSARSFYDPKRLIQRNLPALLEEQNKRASPPPVQPPVSENQR